MHVIEAAQKKIYSVTSGDAGLVALLANHSSGQPGIYADLAPQGSSFPYLTYQFLNEGGDHRFGTDKSLAMAELIFLVKVTVTGQDMTPATEAAEIVDDLLNAIRYSHQDGWIFDCYRESLIYMPLFQDKNYRQAGGKYKILARPAI